MFRKIFAALLFVFAANSIAFADPMIFGFAKLGDDFSINKITSEMKNRYPDKDIVVDSIFSFMHANKRESFSVEIIEEIYDGKEYKYRIGDVYTSPRDGIKTGLKSGNIYTFKQMMDIAKKYNLTFSISKESYVYTDGDEWDSIIVTAGSDNKVNYLNCFVADFKDEGDWMDSARRYTVDKIYGNDTDWGYEMLNEDTFVVRDNKSKILIEFNNVPNDGYLHFIVKPAK